MTLTKSLEKCLEFQDRFVHVPLNNKKVGLGKIEKEKDNLLFLSEAFFIFRGISFFFVVERFWFISTITKLDIGICSTKISGH